MKRLYILILLIFCTTLVASSQTKKRRSNNSATKSERESQTTKKTQDIQLPTGLFSIQELERQRKDAINNIELTTQLLKETSSNAKNSLNRLNLLSQQLMSRRKIVMLLGQEISSIDTKINAIRKDLEVLNKDLEKTKENYAKSMQSQQQEYNTAQYKMLLILSAKNLTQSYRRMRYLREYSNWQKQEAERIVKKQEEINKRQKQLEESRKDKQTLLAQREKESKTLENEESQQKKEVHSLSSKQKDLQKQLDQQRKDANALNKQIEYLIAEEIKESERKKKEEAAKAAAAAKKTNSNSDKKIPTPAKSTTNTKEETTNTFALTESEIHLSNDFASNKGKLPIPLNGKYTIISHFGEHQHQELSHVRTNNDGIDLQTTSGAEARAIFKGVVTRVFVMPGFNNNVIVRHGNYLTVYSNLSQVYVKAGDVVNTRQALGKIYTDTENGNSTVLHFQLWKERTKQDPEIWLN